MHISWSKKENNNLLSLRRPVSVAVRQHTYITWVHLIIKNQHVLQKEGQRRRNNNRKLDILKTKCRYDATFNVVWYIWHGRIMKSPNCFWPSLRLTFCCHSRLSCIIQICRYTFQKRKCHKFLWVEYCYTHHNSEIVRFFASSWLSTALLVVIIGTTLLFHRLRKCSRPLSVTDIRKTERPTAKCIFLDLKRRIKNLFQSKKTGECRCTTGYR